MIEHSSAELHVSCQGAGARLRSASETEKQSRNVAEFNVKYLDVALPFPIKKRKKGLI